MIFIDFFLKNKTALGSSFSLSPVDTWSAQGRRPIITVVIIMRKKAGALSRLHRAMCSERVAAYNGVPFAGRRGESRGRGRREHESPARKKRLTIDGDVSHVWNHDHCWSSFRSYVYRYVHAYASRRTNALYQLGMNRILSSWMSV